MKCRGIRPLHMADAHDAQLFDLVYAPHANIWTFDEANKLIETQGWAVAHIVSYSSDAEHTANAHGYMLPRGTYPFMLPTILLRCAVAPHIRGEYALETPLAPHNMRQAAVFVRMIRNGKTDVGVSYGYMLRWRPIKNQDGRYQLHIHSRHANDVYHNGDVRQKLDAVRIQEDELRYVLTCCERFLPDCQPEESKPPLRAYEIHYCGIDEAIPAFAVFNSLNCTPSYD